MKYLDQLSIDCNFSVLYSELVWHRNNNRNEYTNMAMDLASDPNILTAWLFSEMKLKYTELALKIATMQGNIDVLNWWLESGLELKYNKSRVFHDCELTRDIVIWWLSSGLELYIDGHTVICIIKMVDVDCIKLLNDRGFLTNFKTMISIETVSVDNKDNDLFVIYCKENHLNFIVFSPAIEDKYKSNYQAMIKQRVMKKASDVYTLIVMSGSEQYMIKQ